MAANRRKQDDKNLEVLRELISLNGNKYCLDCNQRGPTYVNTTIGSFVCSKCSGMLRGLTPPHRVKSISMATFTPEEIEFIKVRGNDYCRRVWLGLYEGESVNYTDEQSVKDFMSDKYEKKRYYLESAPNNLAITNGSISVKNKNKFKQQSNTTGSTTPLVSISPQVAKTSNNNTANAINIKIVTNVTSTSDVSHKIPRPVNNVGQSLLNSVLLNDNAVPVSIPVPDFPVDFTTANIYNSAQVNSSLNNNNIQPVASSTPPLNAFNTSYTTSNDRYAALADLDLALRQENMKNMEEGHNIVSKNPFQNATSNDLFGNKNPFFNGGWSTNTTQLPINPFMSPPNNGAIVNSKNPFL